MVPNKLDKKYRIPIILGLLFATYVCNFYSIYATALDMKAGVFAPDLGPLATLVGVLDIIFSYGVVPTLMCALYAFIVWQFGAYRFVRCISRSDFCFFTMLHIAASRLLMGIINAFGIINPDLIYFTTPMLNCLLNGGALMFMFFFTFERVYRFNPAEKFNAFKVWGLWLMIGAALDTVVVDVTMLILRNYPDLLDELLGIPYGANITALTAGCITGIVVYFALLATMIGLGFALKSKARLFTNPETRGAYYDAHPNNPYSYRSDAQDVFSDVPGEENNSNSDDDKVFEEFDI